MSLYNRYEKSHPFFEVNWNSQINYYDIVTQTLESWNCWKWCFKLVYHQYSLILIYTHWCKILLPQISIKPTIVDTRNGSRCWFGVSVWSPALVFCRILSNINGECMFKYYLANAPRLQEKDRMNQETLTFECESAIKPARFLSPISQKEV